MDVPTPTAPWVGHTTRHLFFTGKGGVGKRSGGKMSTDASAVAAITLMTYALKYVEGALNIDVTKAMIDETTQATITGVFAFLGIKPEQIEAELAKGQATETPEPATQAVPEGSA